MTRHDALPTPAVERRAALAGLCATLVGIGLARFAYTPLLPALIEGGWFTPAQAAYLGAANLVGYLAGAVGARALLARVPASLLLRAMMALAAATFLACALRLGFPWFLFWRFLSGLSGGVLMVAVAPTVLGMVAAQRRGRVGGIMFTGVGVGIAASGTLVPFLLRLELVAAWVGLGALAVLLTALAWRGWPADPPRPAPAAVVAGRGRVARPILAVTLLYALDALGLVPHMVFFVDFIARGLARGVEAGASFWVIYGLGAMAGPLLAGWLGDRVGFARALSLGLVLQLAGVLIPLLAPGTLLLAVSALVMGTFTPGMPSLVLGRLHELARGGDQHAAWALATTAFALAQAAGAYGMSWLYARSDGYAPLFLAGAVALAAALALSLATGRGRR
ncbi:MAG TPA: YbfB/YjiJ family MFS transporter [Geminicoccaceae bacterium]|nr:YbfB/YjiJ family MFS transporter [Geminicoccaceae bacterium]